MCSNSLKSNDPTTAGGLLKEELRLGKREYRGLIFSISAGAIYLLIFIYNIIPGLPFSGNLLDYSQKLYIDKLFGYNSFFNSGFVFVVTILFFLAMLPSRKSVIEATANIISATR